jgi:putative membrane protein
VGDLSDVFKNYTPDLNATLGELNNTLKILEDAAGDTHDFLSTFRDVMHEAGAQLDDGTKKTLEGLAAALRDTARSVSKTTNVKRAKNNISDIVEDMWDDYTGDINRLLMMDPTAAAESLTDARNATPTSVQVMIRSAEIRVPDAVDDEADKTKEKTTFFGRVAQMFKDLFGFIAGIFS